MTDRYELIVRPAAVAVGRQSAVALPRFRRPPGASGDAVLTWGRESQFQFSDPPAAPENAIYVNLPPIDTSDPNATDGPDLGLIFTETARQTSTVRVFNPQDSADYVDVERIERISFRGPDGLIRTFVLNN